MRKLSLLFIFIVFTGCKSFDSTPPNILFVISDDQSYPHASIYETKWIKTPGFDRVAKKGLLFNHAYTTNAKCSPSRSSILTGRDSWLLEAAANHFPFFPEKFITFPEVLKKKWLQNWKNWKRMGSGHCIEKWKKKEFNR